LESIKAIGFDLFNTLITADKGAVDEAVRRLTKKLHQDGLDFEDDMFYITYRKTALEFVERAEKDGIETHNRFWISATLHKLGFRINPDDQRIADALVSYFSAFFDYCHLIPGTISMLNCVRSGYRLAMLSNFTHGPACRGLVDHFGLSSFFDVILVSGELGYRKPHPGVFNRLVDELDVKPDSVIYVGDNLEADVMGALNAGIKPVWFTYAKDKRVEMVPGDRGREIRDPEFDVVTVRDWDSFLELLEDSRILPGCKETFGD